jgi:hypothetical protein
VRWSSFLRLDWASLDLEKEIVMKTGIFIAMAALALAVFAVPNAQGNSGPDLSMSVAGSNFITSSGDDGRPTPLGQVSTSMQSGISKGSGSAIFTAQTVIEQFGQDGRCSPLVGADLSTTIVLTYNDGSILSLVTGAGSHYCTDGSVFIVDFGGTVEGGEGRFEGATGTWTGTALSEPVARLTGELSVDLD